MKKKLLFLIICLFINNIVFGGLKLKSGKNRESQKMKKEIDRIEKRVNEISKNIETYKANEKKLADLELKYEETVADLKIK